MRKKNKKKQKRIFKFLLIAFLIVFSITFYFDNQTKIEVSVKNNKLNEMMTINIDLLKNHKYVEAKSLDIILYHKYKKDEKVELELKPYAPGQYSFYYYPQIQGDYILDVTANISGEEKYTNKVIEVL